MMLPAVETLTPAETAVVASVSVRDVNRVIDEKILPDPLYAVDRDRTRRLYVDSCVFIAFYFQAAGRLTAEERSQTIATATRQLRDQRRWRTLFTDWKVPDPESRIGEWTISAEFLTIDLAPFLQRTRKRLIRLMAARALVTKDPEILGGTPVVRGTRIPVYDIAASVQAGLPRESIRKAYPGLSADDIDLAAFYAEANPPRGRPRRTTEPPPGSAIVSAHRAPRRQRK